MAEQLRRFDHSEGVVFIGKAQEKTPLFRTEKGRNLPERSTLSLDCSLYSPGRSLVLVLSGSIFRS
jgi:hypothetical protein